jgi:hypothetical protein
MHGVHGCHPKHARDKLVLESHDRSMDTKVVLVDPSRDGADVGFAVLDRLKAEMLHRVGLSGLPTPTSRTNEGLSQ